MVYAQRDYQQSIGIPPTKYTIAQVGCLLTSFANLRSRFGWDISPPELNDAFVVRQLYTDIDDGVKDDLAWNTICELDPRIEIVETGLAWPPPSNNAIVKFVYNGGKTHFSLVIDASRGLIIDSYDGQIKSWDVYGGVKAWATYKDNQGVSMIEPQTIISTFADFHAGVPSDAQIKYYGNHPNGYDELHTDLAKYNLNARLDAEAKVVALTQELADRKDTPAVTPAPNAPTPDIPPPDTGYTATDRATAKETNTLLKDLYNKFTSIFKSK